MLQQLTVKKYMGLYTYVGYYDFWTHFEMETNIFTIFTLHNIILSNFIITTKTLVIIYL